LLLYWSMGYPEDFSPLVDCLYYCEFDPTNCGFAPGRVPVYFLHGAMHLVVMGDGKIRKITRGVNETVLEQFGKPHCGDERSRPLLITEGSWRDKLQAIEENDYLSHALGRFRRCNLPLVIFGSAMGDQDRHLADAINLHPKRPVAISLREGERTELRRRQNEIRALLETDLVYFFNAESHPLGTPGWAESTEFWQRAA
jgi:Domain of unknown function (DUF4917)